MSEAQQEGPEPVMLAEGEFAMFEAEGGARVIRYQTVVAYTGPAVPEGETAFHLSEEKFIAIPAEIVPALEALAANPDALMRISNGPMGAMARRMAGRAMAQLGQADGS